MEKSSLAQSIAQYKRAELKKTIRKEVREVLIGMAYALISLAMVIGSMSIALAER